MKKTYLLLMILFTFLIGGCTIVYSPSINDNNQENDDDSENPQLPPENNPPQDSMIDPEALFYPNTLSLTNPLITNYSYIDQNLSSNYKIYSAYYSQQYDTIYIAYDYTNQSKQTLKAKGH